MITFVRNDWQGSTGGLTAEPSLHPIEFGRAPIWRIEPAVFCTTETFNRDNNMNFLPLAIGAPGLPELVVIALIILLLFGGTKLPALMRNLGRSTNEFKRGMSETAAEDDKTDSQSEQV